MRSWPGPRRRPILGDTHVGARRSRELLGPMTGIAVMGFRDSGRIFFWNRGCTDIFGYPPEEVLDEDVVATLVPRSRQGRVRERLQEVAASGQAPAPEVYRLRRKDGTDVTLLVAHSVVEGGDGRPEIYTIHVPLTPELQDREGELVDRANLRALIDAVPQMISLARRDGTLVLVNGALAAALGRDPAELEGRADHEVLPDELCTDAPDVPEHEFVHARHGRRIVQTVRLPFHTAGHAESCVLSVSHDVTEVRRNARERRRLDEQVGHAQKLESLGLLAGGIAHEFNNLLLSIIGHADLLQLELPPEHGGREALEQITQAGFRAADLCNQLLAYSGKGQVTKDDLDIAQLVRSMEPLLRVSLGGARLLLELADGLPPVAGDAAQLRQVVMNLVTNAAEAVRGRDGTIRIRTRSCAHDETSLCDGMTGEALPAGDYVVLEVVDDGCGMEIEALGRAFDPFYTTKFTGRGLGLAAVLGIVRSHGGTIEARSEAGVGSTFTVHLPAAASIDEPATTTAVAPAGARPTAVGRDQRGRVLIVDDEPQIRAVAAQMLELAGWQVTSAEDGYEALALFGSEPDRFDVVLLDMTMPGISGAEALARIRQFRPEQPVLLTSGYNEQEVADLLVQDAACAFIQKPYTAARLREQVARLVR